MGSPYEEKVDTNDGMIERSDDCWIIFVSMASTANAVRHNILDKISQQIKSPHRCKLIESYLLEHQLFNFYCCPYKEVCLQYKTSVSN
uniref:Uncharacterized protein n=1 Tax=Arion vulgaris TaxID=1028688 RepID=A0A0B7A6K6_9EUPU